MDMNNKQTSQKSSRRRLCGHIDYKPIMVFRHFQAAMAILLVTFSNSCGGSTAPRAGNITSFAITALFLNSLFRSPLPHYSTRCLVA